MQRFIHDFHPYFGFLVVEFQIQVLEFVLVFSIGSPTVIRPFPRAKNSNRARWMVLLSKSVAVCKIHRTQLEVELVAIFIGRRYN